MKIPLLSSLLYTFGSKKINQEVEEDLKKDDPPSSAGASAIQESVIEGRRTCSCKCNGCKRI